MLRPALCRRRARPACAPARAGRAAAAAVALLAVALGAPAPARGDAGREAPSSAAHRHEDFGPALARHGEWLTLADLGVAWRPQAVPAGWAPYQRGEWAWTRLGWFWVSDEPWAWATYHYGRWSFHPSHGWVWTPGATWAPAWVAWRSNAEVVGWAPLPPRGAVRLPGAWTFVPAERFVGHPVTAAALPSPRVPALLLATAGRTTPPALWTADGMRSQEAGAVLAAPAPARAAASARLGAATGLRSRH